MQKSLCQRVSLVELSEHLNPTGELAERRVQQLGVFAEREREANIFITSTTAADVTPEQSQTLLHGCGVEIYKFATWEGSIALEVRSTCKLPLERKLTNIIF